MDTMSQRMQHNENRTPNTALTPEIITNKCNCLGSTYVENDAEYSLYHISDLSHKHGPLLAILREERDYDPATDTKTKNTTIQNIGTLTLEQYENSNITDVLENYEHEDVSFSPEDYPHVETAHEEYITEQATRIINKQLDDHIFQHGLDLIITPNTLTLQFPTAKYAKMAHQTGQYKGNPNTDTDPLENAFINTIVDLTETLFGENTFKATFYYTFECKPWMLQAAEHQHLGLFKNKPATASVKALLQTHPDYTQRDIADYLETSPSTISRQVNSITDLEQRAEWAQNNS